MELWKFLDKKVKIIDHRNFTFVGVISDYIDPKDNEDGLESIVMDSPDYKYPQEFNETLIKSIEVL